MFRLLIRLAIAAFIANAVWRVGSEYLTFYRFKDDVRNAATFRQGTEADLRLKIEQLAANFDVPLDDDALKISSDENKTVDIAISYVKPIEVLPGYEYPWPFSFAIDSVFTKRF
jgi:hypothetical protein